MKVAAQLLAEKTKVEAMLTKCATVTKNPTYGRWIRRKLGRDFVKIVEAACGVLQACANEGEATQKNLRPTYIARLKLIDCAPSGMWRPTMEEERMELVCWIVHCRRKLG